MTFESLLNATGGILANFSTFRGSSKTIPARHVKSFTHNLCLVASGIRAGFLLDSFTPTDPPELFFSMLRTLSQTLHEFRRVLHIHDQTSNQTFFVNTTLLRESCQGAYILREGEIEEDMRLTSDDWVDCVSLETPPVLMTRQPGLRQIWDHIIGNITLNPSIVVIQIPSDLTSGREYLLIPLAAFLLEYPVGYVPLGASQTTFLSNIPLDVYECVLVLEESREEYMLLKFSCPRCVSQSVSRLAPEEVRGRLVARFHPRLEAVDYPGRLEVRYTQETLPRVGL